MIDYVPFNESEFVRWIQDRGDETHRLNYNLNKNSIVVDAGGYIGQWAYDINSIYESNVYVLEPLSNLYKSICSRFTNNPKVVCYNFAIGSSNCEMEISVDTDSSSLYNTEADNKEVIKCIDVKDFLNDNSIQFIDLFKINIEGGEYDLLERIIELNLINKVKDFQIQFHRFIPECAERRERIQQTLSQTHNLTWNYDWIWENWSLKN